MTPKKKAIRLFTIMYGEFENGISHKEAKRCALILVNEMIGYLEKDGFSTQIEYWQQVKQEIEKI